MKQMARQCSRGVEDLVEVIVSRLEIEAQLSRLRLVEFITGLQRSRELMTFKKQASCQDHKKDLHGGEGVEPGDKLGSSLPVHWQKA